MANWGNSFAQGLSDGWKFGTMYRDRKREEELTDFAKEQQAGIGKQDVSNQVNAYDAKNNKELNDIFGAGTAEELGQSTSDRHFIDPNARPEHVAAGPVYDRRQFYDDMAGKAYGLGMGDRAERYLDAADRQEMYGLQKRQIEGQLSDADRKRDRQEALDFDIASAMELGTPEEQTAGVLAAYRKFDPKAAAELENTYTQRDLNKLTLRGKQLQQGYTEAYMKGGLDGAVQWYSQVNDGFDAKLVRGKNGQMQLVKYDPRDPEGTATALVSGDERKVSSWLGASMTPGGFLELAKTEADIRLKDAYANAAGRRGSGGDSLQERVFNSYVAETMRNHPGIPRSQAETMAYAKLRDDYSQRDTPAAKGPSIDDVIKTEERLAMSVPGWEKASPEERQVLVDRELARFFPRQGAPAQGSGAPVLFAEGADGQPQQRGLPAAGDRFLPFDDKTGAVLRARADELFRNDRERVEQARYLEELRRRAEEERRGAPGLPASAFDRLNRQQRGGGF